MIITIIIIIIIIIIINIWLKKLKNDGGRKKQISCNDVKPSVYFIPNKNSYSP